MWEFSDILVWVCLRVWTRLSCVTVCMFFIYIDCGRVCVRVWECVCVCRLYANVRLFLVLFYSVYVRMYECLPVSVLHVICVSLSVSVHTHTECFAQVCVCVRVCVSVCLNITQNEYRSSVNTSKVPIWSNLTLYWQTQFPAFKYVISMKNILNKLVGFWWG